MESVIVTILLGVYISYPCSPSLEPSTSWFESSSSSPFVQHSCDLRGPRICRFGRPATSCAPDASSEFAVDAVLLYARPRPDHDLHLPARLLHIRLSPSPTTCSSLASSTMSPIAMSSSATPQPLSGYASPASSVSHLSRLSPTPSHSKSHHPKHKPVNVFSNDGTFLERFQQLKRVRPSVLCQSTTFLTTPAGRGRKEEAARDDRQVWCSLSALLNRVLTRNLVGSASSTTDL